MFISRRLAAALWLEETGGVPREWVAGETAETDEAFREYCEILWRARLSQGANRELQP